MWIDTSNLSKEDFMSGQTLLIHKEKNWTSFDVVKKIKNLIKERFKIKKIKVGHAGTLDPLATRFPLYKNITSYIFAIPKVPSFA